MSILVALLGCVPLGALDLLSKFPTPAKATYAMAGCATLLLALQLMYIVAFAAVWSAHCDSLGGSLRDEPSHRFGIAVYLVAASSLTAGAMIVISLLGSDAHSLRPVSPADDEYPAEPVAPLLPADVTRPPLGVAPLCCSEYQEVAGSPDYAVALPQHSRQTKSQRSVSFAL
eukprot:CAMPEP_0174839316 /NCGR_PEP_ID=MMETSP1114-20130205/7961_1 /TAXON_ID=312471 /ORGANISM="Neobodo designis, Strain CCAP 1951/1" /LENGTH=171 /DNA_ID=CAMNT_0016073437 /DNA_START=372 /DNA_END=887 /DNA_ORIENTATION=-